MSNNQVEISNPHEMDEIKEKPKGRKREFPINFVLPLQLEECLYHIENTPGSKQIKLVIQSGDNPDEPEVTVIFRKTDSSPITAQGKLRRWEGTSTRFSGQVTVFAWNPGVLVLLAIITITYPLLTCIPTFIIAGSSLQVLDVSCLGLMIGWVLLYLVIFILLDYWSDRLTRHELIEAIQMHLMVKS
ncbi:MAG TPA: hypothetical protein VHL11_21170 [Phototrophicaceae bacterium]|jgi:hypothetical protein|nr:hypothetical protein [Phototrophicaceae bacterium]